MAGYNASHSAVLDAAAPGPIHLNLLGGATIRIALHEIDLSNDTAATPGAAAADIRVVRTTSAGTTPVAVTDNKDDPLTVAPTADAGGGAYATDPTDDGNSLLMIGLRQEIPYRWLAYPGRELISAATANNGLALKTISIAGSAFDLLATMRWFE